MYNPFVSAINAAFAELSSNEAHAYYRYRAQSDIQQTVDAALSVGVGVYQLCSFVYALGAMAGELVNETVEASKPDVKSQARNLRILPPCPGPLALLAPAKPDTSETPINALVDAIADTDSFRRETHSKLTKAQLIRLAKSRGLKVTQAMRKAQIVEALLA